MAGSLTIAAAQTVPRAGDVPASVADHLELLDLAARHGARIVVFPELSLTGYELDRARELAFSEADERLSPLASAAARAGTTLVVGAPVRLDGTLHLGACVLGPDGAIDVYTKRRLGAFPPDANPGGPVPPAEASVFEPGERDPLLQVEDRRAAVAICADIGDPAHPARAAQRGADLYLASMFVIPADLELEAGRLAGYARRHAMAVVLANYGGPSGGLPAAGASAIWSESGERVAGLDGPGPGVALATRSEGGWRGRAVRTSDG